jgi:hypothetical protein
MAERTDPFTKAMQDLGKEWFDRKQQAAKSHVVPLGHEVVSAQEMRERVKGNNALLQELLRGDQRDHTIKALLKRKGK